MKRTKPLRLLVIMLSLLIIGLLVINPANRIVADDSTNPEVPVDAPPPPEDPPPADSTITSSQPDSTGQSKNLEDYLNILQIN